MRKVFWLIASFLFIFLVPAISQTSIKGVVKVSGTDVPLPGVKVTLLKQNISTQTNAEGVFTLSYLEPGDEEISLNRTGYITQIKLINIKADAETDLGDFIMKADVQTDIKQEVVLQLSEEQLSSDDSNVQSMTGVLNSNDVYTSQTGYSFSAMRFRTRGYENKYESTYINGVHFIDAERGAFNYSSLGGLNNAFRNKDVVSGYQPNSFAYGGLGSSTNILAKATALPAGSNANLALTNRAYKIRGQFTHSTGILNNGWAFAVSGVVRWATDDGILKSNVDGNFYNSAGLFFSVDKILNDRHSFSLVMYGAPTRRSSQAAVTKETHDLVGGSVSYNPYWGYDNGKIRNSRIVETFDPTVIFSHDWKISKSQQLRTGVGFHYSWYSNSAFAYDGLNPSPDYYRNMPSFITGDELAKETLSEIWRTDKYNRQVKWNEMYIANKNNNDTLPNGQARYLLERRHNDLMEGIINSIYTNELNKNLKLTTGVEMRISKGMHYVTIDDLLGANQFIDKDTYAERDLVGGTLQDVDPRIIENDLNDTNKNKHNGDIIRYNYDMHVASANAFAQVEWNISRLSMYLGTKLSYTQFYRFGHMENGRAWYLREVKGQNVNSYGKGNTWFFTDPSLKAGFGFKVDNRSRITINILAETQAPLVQDAYISERIKDVLVPNLTTEKIMSTDINYIFNYKPIRGRLSLFHTQVKDAVEKYGYFDDEYKTFINHMLSGVNKQYQGVELGLTIPLSSMFSISAAGTYADYSYTDNTLGVKSYENGAEDDVEETVLIKGLKISTGPQLAANVTLDFFKNMWFADITLNYYDKNYLDFAPNRFTESNQSKMKLYPDLYEKLGKQERLKGGFMMDASIGRLVYLKTRRSINFNLSLSNLLNNTNMITGGYQQARIPTNSDKSINASGADWYLNKYYYAWGFNLFFHVGYKF